MILEGLVTTIGADGTPHLAPMGPVVNSALDRLILRPFQASTTFANLKRSGQGVFHITDDVELLARTAVNRLQKRPELIPATAVAGWILADACRWYAFRVESIDDRQARAQIEANVVDRGRRRDFLGFNRGKHAVVEAAILATRTAFLPAAEILADFARLAVLVQKTGGAQEHRAFDFLSDYVRAELGVTEPEDDSRKDS